MTGANQHRQNPHHPKVPLYRVRTNHLLHSSVLADGSCSHFWLSFAFIAFTETWTDNDQTPSRSYNSSKAPSRTSPWLKSTTKAKLSEYKLPMKWRIVLLYNISISIASPKYGIATKTTSATSSPKTFCLSFKTALFQLNPANGNPRYQKQEWSTLLTRLKLSLWKRKKLVC